MQVNRPGRLTLKLERLESRDMLSAGWSQFNHDMQHTGMSDARAQSLDEVRWRTTVDLIGGGQGYFEHYGTPAITAANTVAVPVKTGSTTYRLDALRGSNGQSLWSLPTDFKRLSGTEVYFGPALTPSNRLYFPGAGGTVYYVDNPDTPGATITGQFAFYGIENYDPSLDTKVYITTPLTADSAGNVYFGFEASGTGSLGLTNGFARVAPDGTGRWISTKRAVNNSSFSRPAYNAAPALSNDEQTVYVVIETDSDGQLVALDNVRLSPKSKVIMKDPETGGTAFVANASSASPMVGQDGDVYFGVSNFDSEGWMLHYSADLKQTKIPGGFGWDSTASVVPADMVPSYTGSSEYLITTKYNNYGFSYEMAVLDPNAAMRDPESGVDVMNTVLTVDSPNPVFEWCVNAAAVDPKSKSIFINNADSYLYRWDLTTNTLRQQIRMSDGYFEAYTPTMIGPDGTVYAINKSNLYAVQAVSRSTSWDFDLLATTISTPTAEILQTVATTNVEEPREVQIPPNASSELESQNFLEHLGKRVRGQVCQRALICDDSVRVFTLCEAVLESPAGRTSCD